MTELKIVPTMLTIKETAKKTKLSEYYLRQLVHDRKIVFVYTGRKYLINYEKLVDFLNRGDTEPPREQATPRYGVIRAL